MNYKATHLRLGVSAYDRTSSLLIALLILVGMTVLGLGIVYLTLEFLNRTVVVPVQIAEPAMGQAAAGDDQSLAPPALEDAPELVEPELPELLSELSTIARDPALLDNRFFDSADAAARGAGAGDGRGEGPVGTGTGSENWGRFRIRYQDPYSIDAYAKQLDFFNIELALLGEDNRVYYAFQLSQPTPNTRVGDPRDETRVRFTWLDGPLRRADQRLLTRAGFSPKRRPILQCIPDALAADLLRLEREFSGGKDTSEIRRTTVSVVEDGSGGYRMEVVDVR